MPRHAGAPLTASSVAAAAAAGGRAPLITDGSWWPTGSLCHGAVVGIGWPDVGCPPPRTVCSDPPRAVPPAPDETRVAFGSTPTDALGALMVGFLAAAQGVPEDEVLSRGPHARGVPARAAGGDRPPGRPGAARRGAARQQLPRDAGRPAHGQPSAAPAAPAAPVAPAGADAAARHGAPCMRRLRRHPGCRPRTRRSRRPGDAARRLAPRPLPNRLPRTPSSGRSRAGSARASPPSSCRAVKRSLKHGGDGRFSHDGTLVCRLGGFFVTALSAAVGAGGRARDRHRRRSARGRIRPPRHAARGQRLVERDGAARPRLRRARRRCRSPPSPPRRSSMAFMVEQTVWWALRDPLVDPTALLAHVGPGAARCPRRSRSPRPPPRGRHVTSTGRSRSSRRPGGAADWTLGEIDLGPADPAIPDATPGTGIRSPGRSLLTGGIAQAAAAAGRAGDRRRSARRQRGRRPRRQQRLRARLRARDTRPADRGSRRRQRQPGDADDRGSARCRPAQHGRARGDARGRARDAARRAARPAGGNRRSASARAGSRRDRRVRGNPAAGPHAARRLPSARSSTCSDPARAARPTRRAPPRRAR